MNKKKWLLAVVVLAAGAGAWYWFAPPGLGGRARASEKGKTFETRTVKVERGEVNLSLRETGTVVARVSVDVRSRVSGKIREMFVEEGDAVKAGQRLAVVEPDVQEALRLAERRTRVEEMLRSLEQRRRDMERTRALHRDGFLSQQEMDRAEVELGNAERAFELERASLDALEREYSLPAGGRGDGGGAALADHFVTAPIAGVVTKALVKAGELVTSGVSGISREGSHLMTIADVSDMVVLSQLSEVDVGKVKVGAPVAVTFPSMPDITLGAKLEKASFAGNRDERNLVRFPITIRLDDPRHPALRPGISCNADIHVEKRENVLRVPVLAVAEKGGKATVNLKISSGPGNGKKGAAAFEPREITLGLKGEAYVEVTGGLAEGDEVAANYAGDKPPDGPQSGSKGRRMR